MTSLSAARLKKFFLPLIIGFLGLVLIVLAGALWYGEATAEVTITPLAKPISATFDLVLIKDTDQAAAGQLAAKITETKMTETVSATPPAEGALVDAHAGGTMTVINDTDRAQPLMAGTRFKSTDGVIVRSDRRIDVPAHGQTTVHVTADPVGETGNLPPGRFIIVALWSATQSKIYGRTDTALVGGQIRAGSTLDVSTLTTASNQADKLIQDKFGVSTPGEFHQIIPDQVSSNPPASQASDRYQVTVTVKARTITYDSASLSAKARQELNKKIEPGLELFSTLEPIIAIPNDNRNIFRVTIEGVAAIKSSNANLQAANLVNLTKDEVNQRLTSTGLIKNASVSISPAWQNTLPSNTSHIRVIRLDPAA